MSSLDIKGKDFLLLAFQRAGDDWTHATTAELLGPQSELKKVAKKKEGNALPQLERMGSSRRQQIQEVANELTAREPSHVFWEPVVIKTMKDYKNDEGKISVTEFNVLFARRVRKESPPPKVKVVKPVAPPKLAVPKPEEKPKEDPKPKPKTYRRTSKLNDPFNSTPLFSPKGEPMDSRGPIPFENAGLAPGIGAERPIGYKPPPPPPAQAPAAQSAPFIQPPGLGNLGDLFLGEVKPGEIEGIVEVPEDLAYDRRHRESRPRPRSRSRRRSSAVPEGARQFRTVNRYSDHYPSSRSSWASDDSAIQGEWSDLSSRTSEETYDSSHRSPYRKTYRTMAPVRKYYYRASGLQPEGRILIENDRRPQLAAIEDRQESSRYERPLPRRSSTQSRPLVHQSSRPQSRQEIPPEAPFPPSNTDERVQERYADNYMREKEREEAASPRGYGKPRYTFEPRESREYRPYF